ncbi:MAG: hypothetical protein LUD78_12480 [Clostridiales bacterium]|nr:hypothetical protein [Clostridiales bacterium]
MSKHKKISIVEFTKRYSTEEACREHLVEQGGTSMRHQKSKQKRGVLAPILLFALLAALLASAFLLAQYSYTSATEKNANEALADQVDTDADDETDENGV